ncbi:MAG: RNase adapter RapZ [Pseudomonadota bacterium]|jgi:UPF0042 nucleotide-binding protein
MKLIIVSGLSGAGKTIALHSLEDMGAYCIDNLPVGLLPAFAEQADKLGIMHQWVAIGVDARTTALHDMPALLQRLSDTHIHYEVLFLEADDAVLIKRFSETRRKHPLTSANLPLAEAIRHERTLLASLATRAHVRIDTSQMHVHQLRDMIRLRLNLQVRQQISLLFQSFGFKYGVPSDADFVFDLRCLPNPHWELELRSLTGCDPAVQNFLMTQPKVQQMQSNLIQFLDTWIPQFVADNRSYLTLALGCTGGQHRSVYMAEQLASYFRQSYDGVLVRHRELL